MSKWYTYAPLLKSKYCVTNGDAVLLPMCLCSTMSMWHFVYVALCLCGTMSMWHYVYVALCLCGMSNVTLIMLIVNNSYYYLFDSYT